MTRQMFAALLSLSFASVASAANNTWIFDFTQGSFSQSNTSSSGFGIGLHIDPHPNVIGQFTSPDGQSTGIFNSELDSGAGQSYASFSQFKTASADPTQNEWSLTVGDSQYQFTPDFSGLTADSVPQITIISPLDGATTDNPPTFQWNLSGTPNGELVQVSNADFTVDEHFSLIPTQTSFTLPDSLPAGTYNFFLDWSATTVNIPVTLTHISGPLLSITPEGTFQSSGEAFETFTVVPEPASLALFASAGLIFVCRAKTKGND